MAQPTVARRTTRQQTLVRELVAELDTLTSAQEIHQLLRSRGESVGLATVYRTLQTLSESAEVDSVRNESGEVLYRQCSTKHHHHLVCRACGRAVELTGPAVERWADKAAAEHGFTDVSHTVEIFGLCPDCG
ncbi:MAG: Fur family transcriptional regulator [Actinomycetota bacterium]|nr:Fur family transcriptional regulator [Actinomycetota bacterium]